MKSFEKKTLILSVITVVSSLIQFYGAELVEPTTFFDVIKSALYVAWAIANYVGGVTCIVRLIFHCVIRLRIKYREAAKAHSSGMSKKFSLFFNFLKWLGTFKKWLNTDDKE